jgi:hypothetical protein
MVMRHWRNWWFELDPTRIIIYQHMTQIWTTHAFLRLWAMKEINLLTWRAPCHHDWYPTLHVMYLIQEVYICMKRKEPMWDKIQINKETMKRLAREEMKCWGRLTFQLSSQLTQNFIKCIPKMRKGFFGYEWCREASQILLRNIYMYQRAYNLPLLNK